MENCGVFRLPEKQTHFRTTADAECTSVNTTHVWRCHRFRDGNTPACVTFGCRGLPYVMRPETRRQVAAAGTRVASCALLLVLSWNPACRSLGYRRPEPLAVEAVGVVFQRSLKVYTKIRRLSSIISFFSSLYSMLRCTLCRQCNHYAA